MRSPATKSATFFFISGALTFQNLYMTCAQQEEAGTLQKSRTVFLLGPTGVGKSWLGNKISSKKDFRESFFSHSETTQIQAVEAVKTLWRRVYENEQREEQATLNVKVIDTPGLSDTKGRSILFLDDIVKQIKKEKPHGLIFVVNVNTITTIEFRLAMEAFAECLGPAALRQTRATLLVVNQLPDEERLAEQKESNILSTLVNQKLQLVSDILSQDDPDFKLTRAVGIQTKANETQIDAVRKQIAAMPETRMDVSRFRTFTDVLRDTTDALSTTIGAAKAMERRKAETVEMVSNLKKDKEFYVEGVQEGAIAGGLVMAGGAGAIIAFIPGVNVAAAAAAGGAGMMSVAKGVYNKASRERAQTQLMQKQEELETMEKEDINSLIMKEVERLKKFDERMQKLRGMLDKALHDEF